MVSLPYIQALLVAVLLLVVLLPYWGLAVIWSRTVLPQPDQQFTFATTTFLLVLVIADAGFLTRYYMAKQKQELAQMTISLRAGEAALRLTNKKLHLLAGITRHDISNQLTAMKMYLELSRQTPMEPKRYTEYLEKGDQIARAIERQLEFTREYESLGVKSPVFQELSACIARARAGLDLSGTVVTVTGDSRVEVFADPLLEKVFFNLFDNSLRHGGKGMTAITISVAEESDRLRVIFADNGRGIESDKKERIFMQGFGENTGFGLFLIREILGITEITIAEDGTPGKGARFEILVPSVAYRFPPVNRP